MADPLVSRLKHIVIRTLKLEDITPDQIASDRALHECGVEFDSIDSLELAVELEKEFGLRVNSNEGARIPHGSLEDLARLIRERVPAARIGAGAE